MKRSSFLLIALLFTANLHGQNAPRIGMPENLLSGDLGEVDWIAISGYLDGNLEYAPEIFHLPITSLPGSLTT